MASKSTRQCWLMKSEPDVYGIDALERDGETLWDKVRNYQARNFMRDTMRVGDDVLYYHSNAEPSGVVGLARVASGPEVDPTQFEKGEYFDPLASRAEPRWFGVRVRFVERFRQPVTLAQLKADKALKGLLVIQRGQRLSVQPVEPKHFDRIAALGRGGGK